MEISSELAEVAEGKWYDMPGSDARFKVKDLSPDRLKVFRRQCARPRSIEHPDGIDGDLLAQLLLKECMVEWDGMEMDGQPYPRTEENRQYLFDKWPKFYRFWLQLYTSIVTDGQAQQESELGNL